MVAGDRCGAGRVSISAKPVKDGFHATARSRVRTTSSEDTAECAIKSLARIECFLASERDGRYANIDLASEPGSP